MRDADLAFLAAAAYESPVAFERRAHSRGFTLAADPLDHNDTQAFLVEGAEDAALVIRGTEASKLRLRDIRSNLGWPVRWSGPGKVHSGYLRHTLMVAPRALRLVAEIASDKPVYVTGHSLGGEVAGHFTATYYHMNVGAQRQWKLAGLVTFGAPRGLSPLAAREILCPVRCYVLEGDRAPFWQPLMGFVHPGPVIPLPAPLAHHARSWPLIGRHDVEGYVEALRNG